MDTNIAIRRIGPVAALLAAFSPAAIPVLSGALRQEKEHTLAGISPKDAIVKLEGKKYNLLRNDGLKAFSSEIGRLEAQFKDSKSRGPKLAGLSPDDSEGGKSLSKKTRRGLSAMKTAADGVLSGANDRVAGIKQILEINWALESNAHTPYTWRENLDLAEMIVKARQYTLNAVGRGSANRPATDLADYRIGDLSRSDPAPNTFWNRPSPIAARDLFHGFGRQTIPDFSREVVVYDSPHEGFGGHPSFTVKWGGEKYKVKFGEQTTEPFGARIYWALGFHALVTDYQPMVKVRWERRILTDFSDRESNAMRIKFLGIPVARPAKVTYYDPFKFIEAAVLKDGTKLRPDELRSNLLHAHPGSKLPQKPEQHEELYAKPFEEKIDYLVMREANVRPKNPQNNADALGFWDYNALDHPTRREVRAMCVLDAWLDNWDVRWGNNRLLLASERDGEGKLQHVVSDVGAIFGNSTGMLQEYKGRIHNGLVPNSPRTFRWSFTRPLKPGQTSVPIENYMPSSKNQAFYQMNIDDARWMARLIAQLTENQIKQGLIASGWDAVQARMLEEKLVSRRDEMVKDLGLAGEIPLLRPSGVNRKLSYDPRTDGPFEATLENGEKVRAAETDEFTVQDGELKKNRGKTVGRTTTVRRLAKD